MEIDEEYLEELLNVIEPVVYPEGRPGDEDTPDMPEEQLDSRVAEPTDTEADEEEVLVSEVAEATDNEPQLSIADLDPSEGNKVLSADEISALFASAAAAETPVTEEAEPAEKPNIGGIEYDPSEGNKVLSADEINALFAAADASNTNDDTPDSGEEEAIDESADLMSLLADSGDIEELGGDSSESEFSESEINAMLDAAKEGADEVSEIPADDDLLAMLASSGDESLDDIQRLLNADESGISLSEDAFEGDLSAEEKPSETKAEKKARKKQEKLEAKALKKAKKQKGGEEALDTDVILLDGGTKKKGLLARIIEALTETVDDEVGDEFDGLESIDLEFGEAAIDISDENRDILAELDGEKSKKKSKKGKKDKKKKKGEPVEVEGEGEDGENPDEDKKAKKKKPKKEKKPKKVKEEKADGKPERKLPKKRVRRVMLLGFSLAAALFIGVFGITHIAVLQEARWAFDNQDYKTTYEDLYGMKLKGSDEEIFNKSQTIMLMDRKLKSYQNYMTLGMKEQALIALIDAVSDYPSVRENAVKCGVEGQVDYIYSQIIDALGGFGLTESDAREIAMYDSKVKYTKRIQSVVNGTPFTYDEDIAGEGTLTEEAMPSVDDILPEESDFLPDNPDDIWGSVATDNAGPDTEEMNTPTEDMNAADMEAGNVGGGREIEAEVEIIDSRN